MSSRNDHPINDRDVGRDGVSSDVSPQGFATLRIKCRDGRTARDIYEVTNAGRRGRDRIAQRRTPMLLATRRVERPNSLVLTTDIDHAIGNRRGRRSAGFGPPDDGAALQIEGQDFRGGGHDKNAVAYD